MSIRAKMHEDHTVTVSGVDFNTLRDILTGASLSNFKIEFKLRDEMEEIKSRDVSSMTERELIEHERDIDTLNYNRNWAKKIRYSIDRLEECCKQILKDDFAKHIKREPEPEPTLKEKLLKCKAERIFINSIIEEALNASDK